MNPAATAQATRQRIAFLERARRDAEWEAREARDARQRMKLLVMASIAAGTVATLAGLILNLARS